MEEPGLVKSWSSRISLDKSLPSSAASCCSNHSWNRSRTIYLCGFNLWNFYKGVFDDFNYGGRLTDVTISTSSKKDVLLYVGLDGPCDISQKKIQQNFNGKVLFVNTEPRKGDAAEKQRLSDRFYKIGPTEDPSEERTLPVYFGSIFWYAITTPEQRTMFWESLEERQSRIHGESALERRNAVAFLVSNCVSFRREAAARISDLVEVHHGPKCRPLSNHTRRIPDVTGRDYYMENYKVYSKYKYCLVMENTETSGYITEKIVLAYLGGCIPIYWGTKEVWNVFHPSSFIYYDSHAPEAALSELELLLQPNNTAWGIKRSIPILAYGLETLQRYFSLDDSIGGGRLKRDIRNMMGIDVDD